MSSPASPGARSIEPILRLLTASALLALAGIVILFGFIGWVFPPAPFDFLQRFSPEPFTSVAVLVGPLLAVLLTVKLAPVLPQANLLGSIAMIEYAAAFVLGTLALLLSITDRFGRLGDGIYAFGGALELVGHIAATLIELGLLVLATLWTYHLFQQAGGTLLGGRLPGRG